MKEVKAQLVFGSEFLDIYSWNSKTKLKDIVQDERKNMGVPSDNNIQLLRSDPPTGFLGCYLKSPANNAPLNFVPASLEENLIENCQYIIKLSD